MRIEAFDPGKHYEVLASWWAKHNWPAVPLDHLSRLGYVCCDGERPIIAGFLYLTGTAFGIFEFIVANPEAGPKAKHEALALLIESVKIIGKEMGCRSLFTSVGHRGLIRQLKKQGFAETDTGMTNLIGGV